MKFLRFGIAALASLLLPALMIISCNDDDVEKIAIEISPICVELAPGATQQFNATIFVDGVRQDPDPDNNAVVWSVVGGNINGTISNESGNEGFYQAPDLDPPPSDNVTIIAISKDDKQKQNQATVVLSGTCPEL